MSDMMIRMQNISKSYDGEKTFVIRNLNLEIERGEFVALLGPSGCGKSTTLMMLCGLYRPTSGRIYFGDRLVNDVAPKNRNIGMVFQSYALYPNLSVYENIAFPLRQVKGVDKKTIDRKVREVAEIVKIEAFLERMPAQLSGGQQQRVAMSRALVKKPEILMLDEPMSNLDARLKLEIRDEIKKLQGELGLTAIIVTHDQEEAMAISGKIAVMEKGVIQQYAKPDELYEHPKNLFVASFIGTPPMNFIDGILERQGEEYVCRTPCGTLRIPAQSILEQGLKGSKVVLGIRPHNLHLVGGDTENCLGLRLDYVEHLGKDLLLKCHYGEEEGVRVLSGLSAGVHLREAVTVQVDSGSINVFDKESGENVTRFEEVTSHGTEG